MSSAVGSSSNWTVFAVLCFLKIFQQLLTVAKLTNSKTGRAGAVCVMFETRDLTCNCY